MKSSEQTRFDKLYKHHLRALKLQGLSDSTIDVYARAVRRVAQSYDCCPDELTTEQLEAHFSALVESHSWSAVEVEQLISATTKLRYRVFLLTTYSMGLRLGETLALEVGDIDSQRQNEAAHLFMSNHIINTRDHSEAFFSRWLIVEFPNSRLRSVQPLDHTLADRIIAHELSGIAQWALDGAVRLMRNGSL